MASSLADSTLTTTGTAQALLDACAAQDAPAVQKLLLDGADADAAGPRGLTPLLACFPQKLVESPAACIAEARRLGEQSGTREPCSKALTDVVFQLLLHGADPWKASAAGVNALHAAAASSTQVLRLLLNVSGEGSSSSRLQQINQQRTSPDDDAAPCGPAAHSTPKNSTTSSTSSSHQCGAAANPKPAYGGKMGLLAALVCMRGCAVALQLLLDRRLVLDLQAALDCAIAELRVDMASCVLAAGVCPVPGTNYLGRAVQHAANSMHRPNGRDVPHRLSDMLKLLIQHGFNEGGFKAAALAAGQSQNSALVVLHGAGVDMQSDMQQLIGDEGKGKGLLEFALQKGGISSLPLLVSMGVVWQDRPVGQPPLNARSVKDCRPRDLFNMWLQTGVGLHYAQQHGLTAMAAAYRQLQDVLSPPPPLVDFFIQEYQTRHWPQQAGSSWHVGMRSAVLRRTLEVLQDPQQLGQLVQQLEDSGWLQQARQTLKWPKLMTPEAAAVNYVVDAAAFRASGGVVVAPVAPVAAAAADAGDRQTAASTAKGASRQSAQKPATSVAAAASQHTMAAAQTSVDSTAAAEGASSTLSARTALGLPAELVCALDLVTLALLFDRPLQQSGAAKWPVVDVLGQMVVQLLEVMLQLGMPAAYPLVNDGGTAAPLYPIGIVAHTKRYERDGAAAIVQLLVEHGAQLDQCIGRQSCISFSIGKQDVQTLRALLSCPYKMTPAAQKELRSVIATLYQQQQGAAGWLALLSAKGLDVLPHMGDVVDLIPSSAWPEGEMVRAVEALVELGWDINTASTMGSFQTLLYVATSEGQWVLVQWLLDHGAHCGEMDMENLLMIASGHDTLEGVRLLLAAGIVLKPDHIQNLAALMAHHGRYTVSTAEKWLRGQIRMQEKKQPQSKGDNGAQPGGFNGQIDTAAQEAAAAAAAAELLEAEEAAAAATAAKAAKKAGKKQRQAAARAAAAAEAEAAEAEAAAARERHEAEQAAAKAADDSAAAAAAAAAARAASLVEGGAMGSAQAAAAEAVQQAQGHVQQVPDSTQAGSTHSFPPQQQQQQQQHVDAQDRAVAAPAAVPVLPAVSSVGGLPAAGVSSSSSRDTVPVPAVYGASLGSPGTCTTPAALPGVAGLFLELSARRSTGGVAAGTPASAAAAAPGSSAHRGTTNSSSAQHEQLQRLGGSSADGSAALQQAVPAHAAATAATSSRSSGSSMPVGAAAPGLAGGPAPASWSNNSSSSAHRPPAQAEGAAGPPFALAAAGVASDMARLALVEPPGPQPPAEPSSSAAGPMRRPIKVGKSCIVCMEARCCVLQLPCGHLICCEACTQLLRDKGRECPLCRTEVVEYWVM